MSHATHAGAFRVRFVSILTAVYVLFVLAVTLNPKTVDNGLDRYIDKALNQLHAHGIPDFVDYDFLEFTSNIAFFVPVGFLLGLLVPFRAWWLPPFLGAALSTFVELFQKLFLPGRVASLQDVLANTAGAVIGTIIAVLVRIVILHRDTLVIRDVLEGRRAEDGLPIQHATLDPRTGRSTG